MDVVTGVRVFRGPDWKWTWRKLVSRASRLARESRRKPEDGGEGNVGTAADIQQPADASRYGRVPKIGLWGLQIIWI